MRGASSDPIRGGMQPRMTRSVGENAFSVSVENRLSTRGGQIYRTDIFRGETSQSLQMRPRCTTDIS